MDRQTNSFETGESYSSGANAESTTSRVQSLWAGDEGITKSPAIHCELNLKGEVVL